MHQAFAGMFCSIYGGFRVLCKSTLELKLYVCLFLQNLAPCECSMGVEVRHVWGMTETGVGTLGVPKVRI